VKGNSGIIQFAAEEEIQRISRLRGKVGWVKVR